ncbi:MAG: hypothetical protein ACFE8L_01940 [Candidatus Hodarchaeota archaeon]
MSNSFTLKKINHDFKNKKLTLEGTTSLLASLIEGSDNPNFRAECIKEFGRIVPKDNSTFKILENCLISDESPHVRSTAAEILFLKFPKLSLIPLKFILHNDKSILVLKSFLDFLETQDNQYSNELKRELTLNLVKIYNVVHKESKFLLEIESMINIDRNIGFYKFVKKKGHVLALDLAGQKLGAIPESIGSLSHLENLNLWNNNLTSLPESIESLIKLKSLYLDWNNFSILPEIKWERLKALEKLNLNNNVMINNVPDSLFRLAKRNFSKKYVKEGTITTDASVLGLLEFFTGMKLKKTKLDDQIYTHYACNYKINETGHIIGIYLYGYPIFQTCIFPKQICYLEFLEELILRDQNIKQIPDVIYELKSLKRLDLMKNQIKIIPKSMKKLDNLETFDISENDIRRIPEFLKENNIDLWI